MHKKLSAVLYMLDSCNYLYTILLPIGLFSQLAELFKDTTVSLPQQLLNSSHLTQQKARQTKKRHPTHR